MKLMPFFLVVVILLFLEESGASTVRLTELNIVQAPSSKMRSIEPFNLSVVLTWKPEAVSFVDDIATVCIQVLPSSSCVLFCPYLQGDTCQQIEVPASTGEGLSFTEIWFRNLNFPLGKYTNATVYAEATNTAQTRRLVSNRWVVQVWRHTDGQINDLSPLPRTIHGTLSPERSVVAFFHADAMLTISLKSTEGVCHLYVYHNLPVDPPSDDQDCVFSSSLRNASTTYVQTTPRDLYIAVYNYDTVRRCQWRIAFTPGGGSSGIEDDTLTAKDVLTGVGKVLLAILQAFAE